MFSEFTVKTKEGYITYVKETRPLLLELISSLQVGEGEALGEPGGGERLSEDVSLKAKTPNCDLDELVSPSVNK